jgi:hypothetical protein
MAEKVEPRPLPEPINDEGLERWKVQYQYRAGIVLDHILLDQFGAILARIVRAEKDLDQARMGVCHVLARTKHPDARVFPISLSFATDGTLDQVREVCRQLYGTAEADRLFPKEVPE